MKNRTEKEVSLSGQRSKKDTKYREERKNEIKTREAALPIKERKCRSEMSPINNNDSSSATRTQSREGKMALNKPVPGEWTEVIQLCYAIWNLTI